MAKVRVDFNLDEDIKKRVKDFAYHNDTTATELYTKWIIEGLERETSQTRLNIE